MVRESSLYLSLAKNSEILGSGRRETVTFYIIGFLAI